MYDLFQHIVNNKYYSKCYKKHSMSISNTEQGVFSSNLETTSGCKTPIFPITLP